jgi:ADP-heptose:LPS heptosyltransferase
MHNGSGWIPGVRKIAVLRANAIGDFIFTLPAFEALRAAYPQAEIVLLGQHWHNGFLANRPGPIDRVVVVPPSKGVYGIAGREEETEEDPAELDRFFAGMRRESFDLAIQMHGGGRYSNPFVLRLGARFSVGMKTPEAPPLDRWIPYIYYQSEYLRYLEVVGLVGAKPVTVEPHIQVTGRDLAESLQAVPDTRRPLVVLHPGAGDPRRRWPAENFAALGDALAGEGALVLVTGTQVESDVAAAVITNMQVEAVNLCGRISLEALAGLFSRSQVVISNDSGPLHLAGAIGTPTVGIYWCGNSILAQPPLRKRNRLIISWRLECPVCGCSIIYSPCKHIFSYVDEVKVEDVLEAAREFVQPVIKPYPVQFTGHITEPEGIPDQNTH